MVLLRVVFRILGLANTLVLVRLLVPGDFGLVGLATVAYSVFDMLSQLSFQLAIIRMESPRRVHYDTAWTMGVVRGATIAALIVASSPLLANFVGEPRVISVSYVLGALALMQGFENIALVDFQRDLQFDRLFWYQVTGKIVGVLVALPAAFLLRNYWALVCGISAVRVTTFAMGYAMKPYRPRFSLAGWRDLFNFSKWLMITNALTVVDTYCMTLTVGRIAGTSAIGIYQVANQIGSLPSSEIAAPIRDPIFAGYSRIADHLDLLRRHFLSNFSLLVAVIAPLSLGICVMAEPITTLFLGQKWMAAVSLIRLTALYALLDSIGHSAGAIYMTLHRQRRFVGLFLLVIAVRIPAIVLGAYIDGVTGAAIALVITAAFNMVLWNGYLPAELAVGARDYWYACWRTILACAVMTASVWALSEYWPVPAATWSAFVRFIAICVAGATVHIVTQFTAWNLSGAPATAEAEVMHLVLAMQKRLARVLFGEATNSA